MKMNINMKQIKLKIKLVKRITTLLNQTIIHVHSDLMLHNVKKVDNINFRFKLARKQSDLPILIFSFSLYKCWDPTDLGCPLNVVPRPSGRIPKKIGKGKGDGKQKM